MERKGRVQTAAAIVGSQVDWLTAIRDRADKAINEWLQRLLTEWGPLVERNRPNQECLARPQHNRETPPGSAGEAVKV